MRGRWVWPMRTLAMVDSDGLKVDSGGFKVVDG